MNTIQTLLLNIAIEFDRICKKHKLRYFISAGTLLGAVRHQGFIPWDDDIDFYMPREDYEKFLKIAPEELNERYSLRDFSIDGEKYEYCFAKVDDRTTTFIEKASASYYYKGGVWIDIFPLDGTFESKILQKTHLFLIRKMVKLRNKAYTFDFKQKMGIIHRLHLRILRYFMKGSGAYRFINMLLQIKKYNQSKYVGNLVWGYKMKEIVPKDYYEPQGIIKFENHTFSSPHKVHQYLEQIYGDYMQLPPENERISRHPIFYVNLEKTYKSFEYKI